MAKYEQYLTGDLPLDYKSLTKVFRTLAKTADQRLVRLEGYRHEKNFRTADKWSYARAMRDIRAWSPSLDPNRDTMRFNRDMPDNVAQLRAKIEDIKTFLTAPTSTKQGIIKVLQKRADSVNKKFGTNFKWDQIGTFFESETWKKIDEAYASDTAVDVVATLMKNEKEIVDGIKKESEINIKVPDSQLSSLVNDFIAENGEDVLAIFKALKK